MQSPTNPSIARADNLAAAGRAAEAILLLNRLAAANDRDALFKLADWRLTGKFMPRDLVASRDLFRRASVAGHARAKAIYIALLANGTGGPSDWPKAIDLLRANAAADPAAKRQLGVIEAMSLTPEGNPLSWPEPELLSSAPFVAIYRKALTERECKYLAEAAEPLFQASVIVSPEGRQIRNPIRTSEGADFSWIREDPAIHAINRRLAAISGTQVEQGEPMQVLRYRPGQEYKPHFDAVPGLDNQRIMTALVYLNEGYRGGETYFPHVQLKVGARRGDVLLFRNVGPDNQRDPSSIHAGLPVTKGVKLLASRWIRERRL